MFPAILALSLAFGLRLGVAAQVNSSTVVCIAGQCLQGFANLTLGTQLSVPGSATDAILLPGSYSETTNPAFLHQMLTSSNGKLTPSPGFENASSVSLPLNIGLEAGVAFYANSLYSGGAAFTALANSSTGNTTAPTSLPAGSLAISSGVWVAVGTGASNKRVILWDSLPDVSQLPASASGSLALLDVQGASCSPVCAGAGVCTSAGTCACPPGFNGTSCETCSPGFFGPHCEACPADCDQCDDGISGSGLCLKPKVTNAPATCNCLNGQCNSDGSCSCNSGWTKSDNGTACAKCATGFFLGSTGNCQICQLGCTQCVDGTGECLACQTGFTQNPNDKTKCLPPQSTTSTGQICPDGSFGAGSTCTPCSAECQTCSGSTSNDCVICANGKYKNQQGQCVSADSNGVCVGSNLIADNIKHECDSCPSKCTSCKIPNFSVASTVNQLQCTGCLPGFVLYNGTCVASCPSGTFLGSDNQTCQQCDSSCGSCLGSATFCLSCAAGGLASQGKCVSSCPSGTFSASGACLQCHPDCASCSGSGFNQCSSCPSDRPVLSNGRCLPTCGKGQFFDPSGSGCQACDSSCSSCSSSGPSGCLACSSSNQVLKAGTCVDAKCTSNTTVISGLGVCLSDLVTVPSVTATGSGSAPIPTITGIDAPTVVIQQGKRALEWWEILLMALGCAFIFLVILMCWRRRARRQRAAQTAKFATNKALNPKLSWRQRFLGRFNWFHRKRPGPIMLPMGPARSFKGESEDVRQLRIQNAELMRHNAQMEDMAIYGAYQYSRKSTVQPDSPRALSTALNERQRPTSMAESSLYSQFTGEAPRAPQPRQPVKTGNLLGMEPLQSRFSLSTHNSSNALPPRGDSPAQVYASRIREDRLTPDATGGSFGSRNLASRNPFRAFDPVTSPHGP